MMPEELLLNVTPQPLIVPEVIKGCNHLTGSWVPVVMNDDETWLEFTYCPKCGEKL